MIPPEPSKTEPPSISAISPSVANTYGLNFFFRVWARSIRFDTESDYICCVCRSYSAGTSGSGLFSFGFRMFITNLFREGRMHEADTLVNELVCNEEEILARALIAFWEGDEAGLREGMQKLPAGERRDTVVFKLIHILYFGGRAENLLHYITYRDSEEYAFYSSLVNGSGETAVSGIAQVLLCSTMRSMKQKKTLLKQLAHHVKGMSEFSEFEFTLVVTGLGILSEMYICAKKHDKAISVLETLCSISRGDKESLSKLGICYFNKHRWAECIEAVSSSGVPGQEKYLAKALYKQEDWRGVIELALERGDAEWSKITLKSLMNLH